MERSLARFALSAQFYTQFMAFQNLIDFAYIEMTTNQTMLPTEQGTNPSWVNIAFACESCCMTPSNNDPF